MDVLVLVANVACWGTLVVVWVVGALANAGSRRAGRARQRLSGRIRGRVDRLAAAGAVLAMAVTITAGQALGSALEVTTAWVRVPGAAILVVSTALAIWARVELGTGWSTMPEISGEHRLHTSGPYAITRHPIYTGLLGMLLGSTLLAGVGQWIVLVVAGLIFVELKIGMEEPLLAATFPDEYARYRQDVPQLVPGLRLGHLAGRPLAGRRRP